MLSVEWKNLGKKFGQKWVFRNLEGEIEAGSNFVVKGANGSGKSTLGKLFVAATESTEGDIKWTFNGEEVDIDQIPQRIAWAAPFMEVPEDMTVSEVLEFHCTFRKSWSEGYLNELLVSAGIENHSNAQIKALSSGQKQRLRLILAMGTESELLILDEPCSNLDSSGISWYVDELKKLVGKTTIVVCSNNRPEEHLENATEIFLGV
tara:strand:+ start:278 stop:895 length:618 start_codon:yes stop_codon:yes gene_type:complete